MAVLIHDPRELDSLFAGGDARRFDLLAPHPPHCEIIMLGCGQPPADQRINRGPEEDSGSAQIPQAPYFLWLWSPSQDETKRLKCTIRALSAAVVDDDDDGGDDDDDGDGDGDDDNNDNDNDDDVFERTPQPEVASKHADRISRAEMR